MMSKFYLIVLIGLLIFPNWLQAEKNLPETNRQPVLSGYVKDGQTGEVLIGATVYIQELKTGGITNLYGFYSVSAPLGDYQVIFSYLGYQNLVQQVSLKDDASFNVVLTPENTSLSEVVVKADGPASHVEAPQMGVEKLQSKTIKEVPAFLGEIDPIKVIQLLPGVQAAAEGSSGFSVRGGNPDQNLILLDEAIVYNAGHLLGFFSVFNNDAIKDVKLYKGDIPARSGGRLASLLDIRMKDGNSKHFTATGGIGLLSSRLTLEGPVFNEKTTFVASGRRTYADLFLPLSSDEGAKNSSLYFYDFNAKISHTFSDKDRLYLSGYFGRDVFNNNFSNMDYGNQTFTGRWNHVFNPKLFMNISAISSNYDYYLGTNAKDADGFEWKSTMTDYSLKADFNYYPNNNHSITFGGQTIYHTNMPGKASGTSDASIYNEVKVRSGYSVEHAVYLENTQKVTPRLNVRYGLRASVFQNLGKATQYLFDSNYNLADSVVYDKKEVYHTYWNLEPRFGITYLLNPSMSIKGSYSRTAQYIHLATNSTASTPLDIWFYSSPNVKPQLSDQVSIGMFKNLNRNRLELSVELYYKKMQNAIDFKDYANLLLNDKIEGELRYGKAYAMGAEFMCRYDVGNWNGWVSYTLSESKRKIEPISHGNWYLSPYDHTNDISAVVSHKMSKRVSLSANWAYYTGSPTTFPIGRFESGGNIIPIYSERNAARMPDYHRLDLACTWRNKEKAGRRWQGEWVFSIYNAYGRHNAYAINFVQDENDKYKTKAEKLYLFTYIPSVTYNFKF